MCGFLKGERSSPLRSAKRAFPKSSCRCRGIGAPRSPHPTSHGSTNLCEFCGQMISDHIAHFFTIHYSLLLITLSEAKQPLSLGLRRAGFPAGEPNRFRSKSHLHMLNNIMRHQYIQKIPDRHYTVGAESIYIHSALLQAAYLYQFFILSQPPCSGALSE